MEAGAVVKTVVVVAVVLPLTIVALVQLLKMGLVLITERIGLGRSVRSLVAESVRASQGAATVALVRMMTIGVVEMMMRMGLRCVLSLVAESVRASLGAATLGLGASDDHGKVGWPVSAVSNALWQDEQ
jgi:hypothetical protein